MTGKHPPGTLLLASSPCPFCGSPSEVLDLSQWCENGETEWVGQCSSLRVGVACDVRPSVRKLTREEAISAICRRAR